MKMLDSGIPRNFFASRQLQLPYKSGHFPNQKGRVNPAGIPYLFFFFLFIADLLSHMGEIYLQELVNLFLLCWCPNQI